jgi:peroxiredoxin
MILLKGEVAPSFELLATPDQKLKLSDLKGRRVVLAFYPSDWSPVCGDQLAIYNESLRIFHKLNAEVIGVSVDSKWCHMAFAKSKSFHFPLLSDFEPKGNVSRSYGAYNEVEGQSKRALFVIDEVGVIQWSHLSPDGINPGADGIIDALENLDNY